MDGGEGTVAIGSAGATFNFPRGLFDWSNVIDVTQGTLTNAGTMTPTDQSDLSGPSQLINKGSIVLSTGIQLAISRNATLVNPVGGLIEVQANDASIGTVTGSDGTLMNEGTVRLSVGAGNYSRITANLDNKGTIDAESGTLDVASTGGNETGGTFTAAGSSTLVLDTGPDVTYMGDLHRLGRRTGLD
jgi:hypothetical protein